MVPPGLPSFPIEPESLGDLDLLDESLGDSETLVASERADWKLPREKSQPLPAISRWQPPVRVLQSEKNRYRPLSGVCIGILTSSPAFPNHRPAAIIQIPTRAHEMSRL